VAKEINSRNDAEIQRIAIYSRKSKFTGKGESIENQIELCRQRIRSDYPQLSQQDILVYEDEGFSGGHTNRPQFQQLMQDARQKKFDAVFCYKLDRISRNIGDFAKLIEELNALGIQFVSIRDKFDTESSMGRAMMYITSVFSQLERETIAERIRDNMHELAKTGRWLGGNPPTGYRSSEMVARRGADGRTRKAYRLEQIPAEAQLVRQIYSLFLEHRSLTGVETHLLQNRVKTKRGHDFTRFSIKNILQNPVYMAADAQAWDYFASLGVEVYADRADFDGTRGIMAYNKTSQKPGRSNEWRDMEEWIIAVGQHEGLIPGADWVGVQTLLNQNKSKSYRRPKSHVALLSGLLFCGDCGGYMRPKLSKRQNAQGEYLYSYLCETKEKSRMHLCQIKNPNGNELDRLVCEEIKKLSGDRDAFIEALEQAKQLLDKQEPVYESQLAQLRKELDEGQRQIAALVDAVAQSDGSAAFEHLTRRINALSEQNADIQARMAELESLTGEHELSDIEFDLLRDLLADFGRTFDTLSIEEKRAALRVFLRRAVWDGESAHVWFLGAQEGEIEFSQENSGSPSGGLEEPQRGDSK
jgi:site-specific DNA recombinase